MKNYQPDPDAYGTPQSSPRSRLMFVSMLFAPLLIGGMLLFGTRDAFPPRLSEEDGAAPTNPSPAMPDGFEGTPRVIDFPDGGPSPVGKISAKDVRFLPLTTPVSAGNLWNPTVRHTKTGELVMTVTGKAAPLWRGPVDDAAFSVETIAGIQTVKKLTALGERTLWSNAAKIGIPDLQLQKSPDGNARLLDKSGKTLWEGILASSPMGSSETSSPHFVETRLGGLKIKGVSGMFTVTRADSDALLWSGRLPENPVILLRENRRFLLRYPNGGWSGSDGVRRVRFEEEAGTVTLTDQTGKVLGERPVVMLRRYESADTRRPDSPAGYVSPDPELTKTGTVFLTYRDRNGKIIRRSKAYREARRMGRSDNLPSGSAAVGGVVPRG